MIRRTHSFARRAAQRNRAIAQRNQRIRDALPLFDHAGIVDQVATLDPRQWDALRVAYDDIERGMQQYLWWRDRERDEQRRYAIYIQMLDELIGADNREEVLADYAERWRDHTSMQQMSYRINALNTSLARLTGRTPLDIFYEAQQRNAGIP